MKSSVFDTLFLIFYSIQQLFLKGFVMRVMKVHEVMAGDVIAEMCRTI